MKRINGLNASKSLWKPEQSLQMIQSQRTVNVFVALMSLIDVGVVDFIGKIMSDQDKDNLDKLCRSIRNIIPYVTATLSVGNTFPS
jgi:hypothetical protein